MKGKAMEKMQSERVKNIPSMNSLLKISIGLIIVAIISSAFVYAETTSVTVDGTSYDIEYTGTGVSISGVEADLDFVSLILSVDVTGSSGTLDITFDRTFFDSQFQGIDDAFIILADGDEPSFSEIDTTAQSRTLSIELPEGTEEVEIIGSIFGASVVEEPPVEEEPPVVEEPKVVVPPVSTPTTEPTTKPPVTTQKPKTECGPGTILKDGVCVLDQRCGPGTILKDDVCVLVPQPQTTPSDAKGMGKELVMALMIGFIVAGTVGLILALISKASKSKD